MRKINGDWIIEIMSRPDWDNEVLELLELCAEERVELGELYSDKLYIDKYGINIEFDERLRSEKQRAEAGQANIYFQGVSFREDCKIPLPFGLVLGDDRRTCIEKINNHANIVHLFRYPDGDDILLEDKDKKYFFKPQYTEDENHFLINIVVYTWDIKLDLNENCMPYKISIEEALQRDR